MAVNKVVYNNKTLIDLTTDSVTVNNLLWNRTAHSKDGSKITGALFKNWPATQTFSETIEDSSGNKVTGSDSANVTGAIVYKRA